MRPFSRVFSLTRWVDQLLRMLRSTRKVFTSLWSRSWPRGFGVVDVRNAEGRSLDQSSRIIDSALQLRESVQGISDRFKGPLEAKSQKNTVMPFVFLLGNHSSGKSSFVNYITGRKVQSTGVAPTDDTFTILAPGPSDVDRDGPAFIGDPDMGFTGLKSYGPTLIHHTQLKVRSNMDGMADFMIVDTPGMIDSPMVRDHVGGTDQRAVMDRGYDFEGVCRWYAERADVILLFFDPDKPGTTGETLQVLTNSLTGLDHKLHIILNKADQFKKIHDFARAYGSLCWNLSKVIQRKDLPRIHTMCLPPKYFPLESQAVPVNVEEEEEEEESLGRALSDLAQSREEVVREVRNAPKRRVDNEITRLADNVSILQMHVKIIRDLTDRYNKKKWEYRGIGAGWVTASGALTGGSFYLEAPIQVVGGAGVVGGLFAGFFLWWQTNALQDLATQLTQPEAFDGSFRRQYARQLADNDEFVSALWVRVREHLRIGLQPDDVAELASMSSSSAKADAAKLDRLVEYEIPGLRRETSPDVKTGGGFVGP